MDVDKVFHMRGGVGETSYSRNSSLQKKASDMVKHIILETVEEVYLATKPKSIGIADLGCSSGPNTLSNLKDMLDKIESSSRNKLKQQAPEFRVFLNDLPTNDFNAIFQALPNFHQLLKQKRKNDENGGTSNIYIAAYPGSFYGRLFPDHCLHFIYSSYSLHWLSKVPPGLYDEQGNSLNKNSIYISEHSPSGVSKAYFDQFEEDFSLFLHSRSDELVSRGKMVLILLGREGFNHVDRGNAFFWKILYQALTNLISKGEVEKEKLESYDVHFYAPCKEEIEAAVKVNGCFEVERLETFEIEKTTAKGMSYGTTVAMTVRSIQESMVAHHFGEAIVEDLFQEYGRLVDEEMAKEEIRPITFLLVLRKP
ncbi:PREDICTED: salicylate carboxymethyltransferase-like [Nicotiana attenuata]|uniref:Jasmonate o-methyltransferase n=1 Tax=Nicotiana attenuata TaxID=49451 RepID=M1E9L0_NICAT|nr:PREDICTED: salicylate carboxymethyltransferase-like [Nicotiana attenuata]AEE39465.1 putative jasmonate O-methyltransferase [Nicotiana attenuata]OIT39467.1 jasmonate o-methyltransferase [Nicotiana attenuata]